MIRGRRGARLAGVNYVLILPYADEATLAAGRKRVAAALRSISATAVPIPPNAFLLSTGAELEATEAEFRDRLGPEIYYALFSVNDFRGLGGLWVTEVGRLFSDAESGPWRN